RPGRGHRLRLRPVAPPRRARTPRAVRGRGRGRRARRPRASRRGGGGVPRPPVLHRRPGPGHGDPGQRRRGAGPAAVPAVRRPARSVRPHLPPVERARPPRRGVIQPGGGGVFPENPEPGSAEERELLEGGELELLGRMPWSSNATFLVKLGHGGRESLAIYKPRKGERPLGDFPRGTLCAREVAAHLVSEALGWGIVPLTILREGPAAV